MHFEVHEYWSLEKAYRKHLRYAACMIDTTTTARVKVFGVQLVVVVFIVYHIYADRGVVELKAGVPARSTVTCIPWHIRVTTSLA